MADEAVEGGNAKAQPAGEHYTAAYWHGQLADYRKAIEEKWLKQRGNLEKHYSREERTDTADREYAIFWANIEVLKEAAYARAPVPVVAPRFKGGKVLASVASDVLERCLVTTFEQSELDDCMKEVRDDLLLYSRGTSWVRLGQAADGAPKAEFDHISAEDFAHEPARKWREVKWVARRAWLDGDAGKKRFGEIFDRVPRKKRDEDPAVAKRDDQAPVWEIWCKTTGKVHFIAEAFDEVLDTKDPWLDLTTFWPCPKPAYGTRKPKSLKPVPDIRQYKDQIEEINEYTARIAALAEGLKLKGFYPAGQGDLTEAIEAAVKAVDNNAILIPVSNFGALGAGTFKDAIVWLPVDQVATLVKTLVELRRVLIEDVYQITGISDVMRGDTEASETLGAQQLKSQWGSLRIRGRQGELARFARDTTRIAAEIIAENFPAEVLAEMSQVELLTNAQKIEKQLALQAQQMQQQQGQPGMAPPATAPAPGAMAEQTAMIGHNGGPPMSKPTWEELVAFLRNDRARGFSIEIETDSTIQPDEDAEKQRRTEFASAVGTLVKEAAPLVMQAPAIGPFVAEVIKFVAQGFRAGRPLEGAIDQLGQMLAGMAQQAAQPKEPPPDPKMAKVKADAAAKAQQLEQDASLEVRGQDIEAQLRARGQDLEALAAERARQAAAIASAAAPTTVPGG
jgi:hypothetical protein